MFDEVIQRLVSKAICDLNEHDNYLLEYDLNEPTLSHKFAEHVNAGMKADVRFADFGFSVDCEYNRKGLEPKRVADTYKCLDQVSEKEKLLYPDVIVHQRGNQITKINLLAVEIKKSNNDKPEDVQFAKWKLRAYKDDLRYQHALYVCFNVGDEFSSSGKPVKEVEWAR